MIDWSTPKYVSIFWPHQLLYVLNLRIKHTIANITQMRSLYLCISFILPLRKCAVSIWRVGCACCGQGVSQVGGFESCCLLWCNTGVTGQQELMNGKLLLMTVKMHLSPHVVLGHLSATGWSCRPRNTLHTLISLSLVAVATSCSISFPVPLHHFSPLLSCTHTLLLSWANLSLILFSFPPANEERQS